MAKPKDAPLTPSLRPRRLRTPDRFGPELRRLLTPAAKGFGFSVPDLLLAWPDIVGPHLAERTVPEKLSRARGGEGSVLTLRCRGSAALEVQHETPKIIERLNTFIGYGLVARIKIVQGDLGRTRPMPKPLTPPLAVDSAQRLDQALVGVEDSSLRSALRRLGAAIMVRKQMTIV
jgi:hypothetical protein